MSLTRHPAREARRGLFNRAAPTVVPPRGAARRSRDREADGVLPVDEATLLDIVDNVLSKGVVLTGDLTIALAQVDLVYARLSLLLCAADRILGGEAREPVERRAARRAARGGRA